MSLRQWSLPVLAVLLLASTALVSAQDAERRRGRRGGRSGGGRTIDQAALLSVKKVREELGISEEQGERIDAVIKSSREESREVFRSLRGGSDLSDEERDAARKALMAKRKELADKRNTQLAAALDESQNQRLDEILLQQQGVSALLSTRVATALKLTEEQSTEILAVLEERRSRRGEGRRGRGGPSGERREGGRRRVSEGHANADGQILSVLSNEQREQFEALQGEPFELDRRSLRSRRGRDRGRAGSERERRGGHERTNRRRPPAEEL